MYIYLLNDILYLQITLTKSELFLISKKYISPNLICPFKILLWQTPVVYLSPSSLILKTQFAICCCRSKWFSVLRGHIFVTTDALPLATEMSASASRVFNVWSMSGMADLLSEFRF